MKTAFIFPGQGAQKVGMGRELFESSSAARATFEEADQALGEELSTLIFEGPQETLTLTANTQPAILTVSIAALRALREACTTEPIFMAGHSLGEFSALVGAGALTFADAVRTVRARGTFMQQAVPAGQGAMAAVMKQTAAEIEAACAEAAKGQIVAPANFNAPGQIVISGDADAVGRATETLSASGGRVIQLEVSAPFHCALMRPAADGLETVLRDVEIGDPAVPVVTNVEATPNTAGERVRELLVSQVTSPVRWTDSMNAMIAAGVELFVELGPGNVLAGLAKRIDAGARVISVSTPQGVAKAVAELTSA